MTAPNVQESDVSANRFGLQPLMIRQRRVRWNVGRIAASRADSGRRQLAARFGPPAILAGEHGSLKPGAKFGTSGKAVSDTFGARTARL